MACEVQGMNAMDVFAYMPVVVLVTGTCIHVPAYETTFSFLAHVRICAFFAATHLLRDYITTCIGSRHTGNMPGVRVGSLKENGKGYTLSSTATLGLQWTLY